MDVIVDIDGKITCSNSGGTQNENNVKELVITVPEQYADFNKKIVFIIGNKMIWDIVEGNTYLLPRAVTQYDSVTFYIWLTKEDKDFRSQEHILSFNENHDLLKRITKEQLNGIDALLDKLDAERIKVAELEAMLLESEEKRVINERQRVSNESIRQVNETTRVSNENDRIAAEAQRQAGFMQMQEEFEKALDDHTLEQIQEFNTNVVTKTEEYNTNTVTKTEEFNANAQTKMSSFNASFDEYVELKKAEIQALIDNDITEVIGGEY